MSGTRTQGARGAVGLVVAGREPGAQRPSATGSDGHDTGPGHPERPARVRAVLERLTERGLMAELARADAPLATPEDLALVHPRAYVERVEATIRRGAAYVDSPDSAVSAGSFDAARAAAGGALFAADQVIAGAWSAAFCALRPPGHHAEEATAMGFCLFNNAALVARHVQRRHGLARVAIVDWDVHHGNGTQHLFERDPSVLYASLHQYPHYPGTGAADERGLGAGEGATLNLPQPAGSGSREWLRAFESALLPALEAFAPDFIVVSAGFDAHALDPLSGTQLDGAAFGAMTRSLVDVAARTARGRLVSILEGGYSLAGLAESAEAHVAALLHPGSSAFEAERCRS
jgi:acetoin utilization deacetylase AcuC-like enzyme